jgi:hypothetical protein
MINHPLKVKTLTTLLHTGEPVRKPLQVNTQDLVKIKVPGMNPSTFAEDVTDDTVQYVH